MFDKLTLDPGSLAVQTFVADSGYMVTFGESDEPSKLCETDVNCPGIE
jgi:hypothetical protein